jgi:hypothetical protein
MFYVLQIQSQSSSKCELRTHLVTNQSSFSMRLWDPTFLDEISEIKVGSELPQRNAIPSILEHKSVQLPWQVHRWRLGARPVTCFGRRIKSGEIRESNCSIWRKHGEIGELNGIQIQHMEAMASFESRCRSLLQIFRCSVDRASAILSRHQRSQLWWQLSARIFAGILSVGGMLLPHFSNLIETESYGPVVTVVVWFCSPMVCPSKYLPGVVHLHWNSQK